MKSRNQSDVAGVMSGTSLDGLDIALCRFDESEEHIAANILNAVTIPYDDQLRQQLAKAHTLNAVEFSLLHNEFGRFIGKHVQQTIRKFDFHPLCIASHGHTVMHHPTQGLTVQIGNGAYIASLTGIDTVCDFRTLDVALGGEGAPLVPFGDIKLFSQYDSALNLGGFSNITFTRTFPPLAFDICPVNIILNDLAMKEGFEFDRNGAMAASGFLIEPLLKELESISLYQNNVKPSLSREWVEQNIHPVIQKYTFSTPDLLRTYSEHIALRISHVLNTYSPINCLVTGGGAYNSFVIDRIRHLTKTSLIIPDDFTIQYKEAFIFAFLGLKRLYIEMNIHSFITHASKDTSSGIIWKG